VSPSRIAVKILFFLNGFIYANWVSRLPRIQDLFSLDNGTLGLVLLSMSLGAVCAMPFTGWLIIRNGSKRITIAASFLYCVFVPIIPWLPPSSPWMLFTLYFIIGITTGMLDVAMNAQAVLVEQALGKPIMTSFHALFSIGMMLGAACGSLFAELQTGLFAHFMIITGAGMMTVMVSSYYLIHDKPIQKDHDAPAFRLPNAAMVSIGVIAFCCMLGEGSMADWSTNYMENVVKADKALAPMALSAFALAMTIGRIFGDRMRILFGDRKLIIICSVIAAVGLSTVLIVIEPVVVIGGFFLVGLGLSVVVPIAYSLAGSTKDLPPGVGLAMVTTVGYTGFLFGPPIIGMIADWSSLRVSLWLVVGLFLVMLLLAAGRKQDPAGK